MTRVPDLSRAARMAYRVLAARQVRALPVEPLPMLRDCRDTAVYTAEEAADALDLRPAEVEALFRDADAFTCRLPRGNAFYYIVIFRRDGHPARLRFTLAHELGHRLLAHTGDDPAEEREADCFASHLLCPEPALRRMASRTAEEIARACYVSHSCARVALRRPAAEVEPALLAAVEGLLKCEIAERTKGDVAGSFARLTE